jgi:hypothetical protein
MVAEINNYRHTVGDISHEAEGLEPVEKMRSRKRKDIVVTSRRHFGFPKVKAPVEAGVTKTHGYSPLHEIWAKAAGLKFWLALGPKISREHQGHCL